MLGGRLMSDLNAVRGGVAAVGEGSRDLQIATGGEDELAQLGRDVEQLAARLGEEESMHWAADGARRDLLAAVSHDLRTPLASIRVLAEAIEDDIVDERTLREYVSRLATHVRALGALIDDLFELSRLEAGDMRWSMEQVAIGDLLEETVDAMRHEAEAGDASVRIDLDGTPAYARANPEQIQRVLFNLLQNAIRHTPPDGSVTVRQRPATPRSRSRWRTPVEGIDADEREAVFDAFVQGRGREARSNGSAGLGLAIARAIVEAHGGRIWLAEAPVGTRVRFSLPAD